MTRYTALVTVYRRAKGRPLSNEDADYLVGQMGRETAIQGMADYISANRKREAVGRTSYYTKTGVAA